MTDRGTRRGTLRGSAVYIYHPVVTKLSVTFVFLGLLLIVALQPGGRDALIGIHQAMGAAFVPSILLLAILFALSTLSVYFPEFLVTVAAGFLLGAVAGSLFAIVMILVCASGNFFIARHYGTHVISLLFDSHSRAEIRWTATRINRLMVFLTWLLPSINFDLISYAGGLSAMPYATFLAISIIGTVLSSLLLAFLGQSLRSDSSVVAVATLFVYTLVGTVLYVKELPVRLVRTATESDSGPGDQ